MSDTLVTQESLINEIHEDMQAEYSDYDRQLSGQVAKIYFESADKEGFIFDFDIVWPWAGYSAKGTAKRAIAGVKGREGNSGGLRENIDFKIVHWGALHNGQIVNQGVLLATPSIQNHTYYSYAHLRGRVDARSLLF
jgi:hypothetical protein